jgi:hypothetical protein
MVIFLGKEKKIFVDKKNYFHTSHMSTLLRKKNTIMTLFVPGVLLDKTL